MRGAATEGFDDAGYVGGEIVERGVFQPTLASSDATHIDRDNL
jgi:hypothetical protein